MSSTICVLYIALFTVAGAADPDALYRDRDNLASARQAAGIWAARLEKDPRDFEAAWKLARAQYWLGGHGTQGERRKDLERGVEAGRQAATINPARPEGHFWMAANMGTLAESFGLRQGLRYRGPIRDSLETVLKINPAFQNGSADRALGRWYLKVPALFGGSKRKSEEHLRKSLSYNPDNTISHFFLTETLFELDRDAEAGKELEKVVAVPIDPEWAPEDREYKRRAEAILTRMRREGRVK